MSRDDKVLLKMSYPKWFQVIVPPILLLYFIFVLAITVYLSRGGFTWLEVAISAFFWAIFALWLWIIPFIYSSLLATDAGLYATDMFRQKKKLSWDEIVRVSRPLFGIPNEFVYVFSRGGKKIVLLRGMEGYSDLLKLIESRAANLSSRGLPQEVWPRKLSWTKVWLVTAGVIVAYIALRLIFK